MPDKTDLFEIFPDLPWPKGRPLADRLKEVRLQAVHARVHGAHAGEVQRVKAAQRQIAWRKRIGR